MVKMFSTDSDLSVKFLRHEIVRIMAKMLIRENNNWQTKPADWPEDIPFVDPNNKTNGKKPNKGTLMKMYEHLKSVEDCQKVELQGSPIKATNEVMDVEPLTKSSAIAKDIVKGACLQLQELKRDLKKLSHCMDSEEKASKNCCGEIKKCVIKLRVCCDDVLSELENVRRSMTKSLDLPLQVMPTEAESLVIQFKKPENYNISSEQECDVLNFMDIRDENAFPVTGEPMAIQTPFATGEHMTTDKPHDTDEPMPTLTPHDTDEPMATLTPHDTGEPVTNLTPSATGEPVTNLTPSATGEPVTNLTPPATGEPVTNLTLSATGEPVTNLTPPATGEPVTNLTPPATGEPVTNLTPSATGEPVTNLTPTATGEPVTNLTAHTTGEPVTNLTAHTTGELMTTRTTVGPITTRLEEVESCNVFDESSNMILMGMLSTIHDAAYGMNHTNSVIVRDDVMWGLSVPSSKLEQDDWLDEAHTAACKHYGCNEDDDTFVQEKEIKAQHDSVRTSKRRASLSSDEPNAKRCMSSMRQF